MRSANHMFKSGSTVTIVLSLVALLSAPALAGCEAGDGTSPLPPAADAASDHATQSDTGAGDAGKSDGATEDAQAAADSGGDAGTSADGATE